jgi:hypothetical protein
MTLAEYLEEEGFIMSQMDKEEQIDILPIDKSRGF